MKILIIGFGKVGFQVMHELRRRLPCVDIFILTTQIVSRYDPHLDGIQFICLRSWEYRKIERIVSSISPTLIVNCLPPHCALFIMQIALAKGAHYLDTSACEPKKTHFEEFPYGYQKQFDDDYKKAGLSAVLSFGCDPGLSNALIRKEITSIGKGTFGIHIFDVDPRYSQTGEFGMNRETKEADLSAEALVYDNQSFLSCGISQYLEWNCKALPAQNLCLMYHDELSSIPFVFSQSVQSMSFWGTVPNLQVLDKYDFNRILKLNIRNDVVINPLLLHMGILIEEYKEGGFSPLSYSFVEVRQNERRGIDSNNAVAFSAAVPAAIVAQTLTTDSIIPHGVWLSEELVLPSLFAECQISGLIISEVEKVDIDIRDNRGCVAEMLPRLNLKDCV